MLLCLWTANAHAQHPILDRVTAPIADKMSECGMIP
jgi:hypothetical protein